MMLRQLSVSTLVLATLGLGSLAQAQGQSVVYRCPGNNFTNAITAKEAEARGCRPVEGGNVTVVESPKPAASRPAPAAAQGGARTTESRVDPAAQRARDADARRILQAELLREEEELAELLKQYNNGEPERLGSERNYQKYLDRVAEMKAAITRKENDIAAIRRELGKLPAPAAAAPASPN